ncbi:unnamed protein product [Ceratitis capitata]|uniref:(Mediterranean fruit fly) hypothetical protein n=1 Tax=Ceratitis capitata TaxID=7213 RepID=A0A811UAY9_CERCA|nr:unnamed protein product [Ceratitis capitata]
MNKFGICCIQFWLTLSIALAKSTPLALNTNKLGKLGPPRTTQALPRTTKSLPVPTTVSPDVAGMPLTAAMNNATGNATAWSNNTSVYDHKHKILLVVLSDVNVREVKDPQQATPTTNRNNAERKIINETTLILDETKLKELLKSLQPATSKCVNVQPRFVPPTFPWIIRKEPRKPITYIEPFICEDTDEVETVLRDQSKSRNSLNAVKTNIASKRLRISKNKRKGQNSRRTDYVLLPAQDAHSRQPLNNFQGVIYAPLTGASDHGNTWEDYSSEER